MLHAMRATLARGAVLALHAEIIAEDLDEELFEVLRVFAAPWR